VSRNARIALLMAVGAVALIAGFVLRQSVSDAPPAVAPEASQQLLSAELADLEGVKQRLEQWKGKVIVVNFWATWCAPCREEIPDLMRGQQRLGEKGLQIVGIAVDDLERVRPYAAEIGINYPVLVSGLEGAALSRLAGNKAEAFPFTVVIDRSGRIAGSHLGRMQLAELEKLVGPLL
jgi:thiol-disulfide isomerase/thioredoxin